MNISASIINLTYDELLLKNYYYEIKPFHLTATLDMVGNQRGRQDLKPTTIYNKIYHLSIPP
jgi:hypothetical protein